MSWISVLKKKINEYENQIKDYVQKFDKREIEILKEIFYADFNNIERFKLYKVFLKHTKDTLKEKKFEILVEEFKMVLGKLEKEGLIHIKIYILEDGKEILMDRYLKDKNIDRNEIDLKEFFKTHMTKAIQSLTRLGIDLLSHIENVSLDSIDFSDLDINF